MQQPPFAFVPLTPPGAQDGGQHQAGGEAQALAALAALQAQQGVLGGLVPGGQEHLGLWFSGKQTALIPHVSAVHTSMHL